MINVPATVTVTITSMDNIPHPVESAGSSTCEDWIPEKVAVAVPSIIVPSAVPAVAFPFATVICVRRRQVPIAREDVVRTVV